MDHQEASLMAKNDVPSSPQLQLALFHLFTCTHCGAPVGNASDPSLAELLRDHLCAERSRWAR
jgi:hypothetical protein